MTPTVQSGDVAGWIGIGRVRVPGKRGSIRAGILSSAGSSPQIFYEVRHLRSGVWQRFLGPQVVAGEAHRLSIVETNRRGRWQVWLDGRVVSARIRLMPELYGKRALATGESWDGGTPTCNQFAFRFGPVVVRHAGPWRRLRARRIVQDPGYAVVRQPSTAFVSHNAPDPSNFFGDWETGDSSQWSGNQWNQSFPLSDQFQIVTDPVRQGNYAAKFIVRPGDRFSTTSGERSEVLWTSSKEADGQDYWYSWSTLFPSDWSEPRNWGIFLQWHAGYSTTPPVVSFGGRQDSVVVNLNAGPISDVCCGGDTRLRWTILSTLSRGQWNDFIAHITWRSGPDGSITIWHKLEGENTYTKVLDVTGVPTLQSKDGIPSKNYVKMGLYRDADTKTNTIYHDGFHRWVSADPPPELAGS